MLRKGSHGDVLAVIGVLGDKQLQRTSESVVDAGRNYIRAAVDGALSAAESVVDRVLPPQSTCTAFALSRLPRI